MLTQEPPAALRRVLVANRGEIAVRVIRAARDAGIGAVAVYAGSDRSALHVRLADAAEPLGDLAARGYLDIAAILAAARRLGADAIHPGYGFLAESADFAAAVQQAGLTWIGPGPEAIRRLGDKLAARGIARAAGAPLAPGTDAPVRDASEVAAFARQHGLPLVIKATRGGGGRGLKVVRTAAEIPESLASARREAESAFGCGDCFAEGYLDRARHVEAQVLADEYGNAVVVGTRDCSLQRRNQKLVEEAPAPFLPAGVQRLICESAVKICRAAGYTGAGTVEYLVGADGTVSFLEVNTRLQVEHPVTEEATGADLVAEQFRIACGAKLRGDAEPEPARHAIEFRITCEDAARGFLPVPGRLTGWRMPSGPGVRIDSGVAAGDVIDGRFDSLLAKLIVTGADRDEAVRRARRALAELVVEGVPTPVPFYRSLLDHPDFAGDARRFAVHNRWVETCLDELPQGAGPQGAGPPRSELTVRVGRRTFVVTMPALSALGDSADDIRERARRGSGPAATAAAGTVTAPMQGTVVAVAVADGQVVAAGDLVAVLEAMKMENRLLAPRAGTVWGLAVASGDTVRQGQVLCQIATAA